MTLLEAPLAMLRQAQPFEIAGTVAAVRGLTLLIDDLPLPVGALVRIEKQGRGATVDRAAACSASMESVPRYGRFARAAPQPAPQTAAHGRSGRTVAPGAPDEPVRGEVIGFDSGRSIVMLLAQNGGIAPGMRAVGEQAAQTIGVGDSLLGRVIDGFGRAIDGRGAPGDLHPSPLHPPPPAPMQRARVRDPLPTGVRAIDGFLTAGRGQRIGIFSAAGVGKSTLLGSIARGSSADVNVIALIGERGREVREFLEESLGEQGRRRSVVVVATGDESPLLRVRAALVACAAAAFFRDRGADVLLMMDSITRLAQAQRQIGLAVGEQPATRGFTPSVFALLPVILERAGAVEGAGSITGFYSVLVEGDDLDEPISDAVRGILDGHIVLSRRLAARGHYPAIDVLQSISRVANDVCDPNHIAARRRLLRLLSAYEQSEELINIGAYARGANPECDVAIAMRPRLLELLQQDADEAATYPLTCRGMVELAGAAEQLAAKLPQQQQHPQHQQQHVAAAARKG